MTELFDNPYFATAMTAALAFGVGYFGVYIVRKNKHVSQLPDEDFPEGVEAKTAAEIKDEDAEVSMALCATKAGKKTHYRKLVKAGLHKRVIGKPTLCGVKAHHDMDDQSFEATCQSCNEALVKFGYPLV